MRRVAWLAAPLCLAACAGGPSTPPPALGLPPFYTQYVSADGIPIVASSRVDPAALLAARDMMKSMLAHRPDLAAALVRDGYRAAIIDEDEALLDLPELANWEKPAPDDVRLTRCERKHYDERIGRLSAREYWDARARGSGGKLLVAAEEDILGRRSSRYWGETIFVHEFAHNVLAAIRSDDLALYREIEAAYAAARRADLWRDEYAMTTLDEYWAEGSQTWFNSNRLMVMGGRNVLSHEDLAAYDPALFAALGRAYGSNHRLRSDPFWMSAARVPTGPIPVNTAEVC